MLASFSAYICVIISRFLRVATGTVRGVDSDGGALPDMTMMVGGKGNSNSDRDLLSTLTIYPSAGNIAEAFSPAPKTVRAFL